MSKFDGTLPAEAADAPSRPVTEEMVERAAAEMWRVAHDDMPPPWEKQPPSERLRWRDDACAILTAALGTPAAGHETYPGHDPAAGLPQPDTAGGAESEAHIPPAEWDRAVAHLAATTREAAIRRGGSHD